jgi:hypothetical protein
MPGLQQFRQARDEPRRRRTVDNVVIQADRQAQDFARRREWQRFSSSSAATRGPACGP